MKIIHCTTVHPREDVRIRMKETPSLNAALDADVLLFVQDGLGDAVDASSGVRIVDTGMRPKGRIKRMTLGAWRMFRAVRKAKPDVFHFHDPELIPIAILMRLSGCKVVYDVHEDLPRQMRHKHYLPRPVAYALGALVDVLERMTTPFFDGYIVVVPAMIRRFPARKTIMVANFPMLEEFPDRPKDVERLSGQFVYVGGLAEVRGLLAMIDAVKCSSRAETRLKLLGNFQPANAQQQVENRAGWSRVDFGGWVDRDGITQALAEAQAGLVLLKHVPNYMISYPVKMFEYMAAGLPFIASDFPFWKEIIDDGGFGITVDPDNPKAIAQAMDWIIENPEAADLMGQRGRQAVEQKYNWAHEADTLIAFYVDRLGARRRSTPRAL